MVKSFKFIAKTMAFEGFAGCVCERKSYQINIENESKIHPEIILNSIQSRCENDAQKSDAKMMENYANTDPQR